MLVLQSKAYINNTCQAELQCFGAEALHQEVNRIDFTIDFFASIVYDFTNFLRKILHLKLLGSEPNSIVLGAIKCLCFYMGYQSVHCQ